MGGNRYTLEAARPLHAAEEADADQLLELVKRLLERNAQLEHALTSRIVIEQAKGILAERYGTDPDGAFDLMRRAARSHRMLLRTLAAEVVARKETPREIVEVAGS